MATNKRVKARAAKAQETNARKTKKLLKDIDAIFQYGPPKNHYVGGGQAYTDGKKE